MEDFKLKEVAWQLPYFFQKRSVENLEELKIYSVSDAYIEYLRKQIPNVYSNKINNRTHTRKYVGVVIEMAGYVKSALDYVALEKLCDKYKICRKRIPNE